MTSLLTEKTMVDEFVAHVPPVEYYVREVPLFAKSVDLVKINAKTSQITAIEFKTTKWRKALLQVLGSVTVFDYLEICILKPATERCRQLIIQECKRNGIGLYFFDNQTKRISHDLQPNNNDEIWEIQHNQLIEYLKERLANE